MVLPLDEMLVLKDFDITITLVVILWDENLKMSTLEIVCRALNESTHDGDIKNMSTKIYEKKTISCYIKYGISIVQLRAYEWHKVVPQDEGEAYLYKDKCNGPL